MLGSGVAGDGMVSSVLWIEGLSPRGVLTLTEIEGIGGEGVGGSGMSRATI